MPRLRAAQSVALPNPAAVSIYSGKRKKIGQADLLSGLRVCSFKELGRKGL